jgi:hypothetical protein
MERGNRKYGADRMKKAVPVRAGCDTIIAKAAAVRPKANPSEADAATEGWNKNDAI